MNTAHNPDLNPSWSPKVAERVYACAICGTESTFSTNHTGTVFSARCRGKCRTIFNPHTAREVVCSADTPHHYAREANAR